MEIKFTGKKDINGKKIYEKDIVVMLDFGMDGLKAQIIWGDWQELGWFYLPLSGNDYARPLMKQHRIKFIKGGDL